LLTGKQFWLGLVGSLVFLALLFYRVDLEKLGGALKGANYLFIIPSLAAYFLSVWFRTLRWQYLLRGSKRVSQGRLYPVVVMGYMANNLLPVRLGELVRAYLLGQREGISKATALATILLERVFDGLVLILMGLALALFLPLGRPLADVSRELRVPPAFVAISIILPFLLVLGLLVAITVYPRLASRLGRVILRLVPLSYRTRTQRVGTMFLEGLQVLRSGSRTIGLVSLSVPIWLAEAAMYYLVMFAFSLDQPFAVALFITSAANLAIIVPSTGGGVGPFEWAAKVSLVALGVDDALATAYAIALHAALLIPVTLLGLVMLWLQNLSLKELTRRPVAAWQDGTGVSPAASDGEGRA